ncbi:uncharacterized protein N7506_005600 [Penicillium brevicompactum]|uniref:uncharacterized protein n=1 Tax=Penicillium brevicompactum TaxID=5074 RepID=UPI0025407D7C|nr:uncharacterized protein N7506_005600 [Penicillium brevicompactum]KAJ5335664.1 hypothetical protein N7506_005600 [Penicillium brevicompactum]
MKSPDSEAEDKTPQFVDSFARNTEHRVHGVLTMTSISFGNANSGTQIGINNGPIYSPPERPESRPDPLSTVPFPHEPDFVSRGALLDRIHDKASIPGSRIVLVGLGGVGKTQLAVEYGHRIRRHSPGTWVFWIHASNAARYEKSFRDLADRAKIPGRQDRNANIFQLVGNWLRDESIGKWVLIIDNIDDDVLLRKPSAIGQESQATGQSNAPTQPLLNYLLENSTGSFIVTSRNKAVAFDIADHKNIIEVQPMSKAEGLNLLQKKLDIPGMREGMVQLVEALEFMPLAIVQAASYIAHRSPRCSVSQYLKKLQESDGEAVRLLNKEAGLHYRDWEAKNSILLTWQISFDHIRGVRSSAADLLSLMSFFDRQGIPESILRAQQRREMRKYLCAETIEDSSGEEDERSVSDLDADETFEDDITTLRDYSLISVGVYSTVFTMHRLVQLTVRTWLETHGQLEHWKEKFIKNLCYEFPTGEYENWVRCRSLFPHVKSALSQRPESTDSLRQWATLLYKGAWYAQASGMFAESREMASNSRKQRAKIFGAEGDETSESTAMLATAYRLEGRWKEAEQLEVQVMETSKTKLGHDHPDTLSSMANLASTYRNQGRWEKAEQLEVQVMDTCKLKLGEEHLDTLSSMANLASTYSKQGRWEEARHLNAQVMESRKMKLGEDHPDTLSSMANLASTYRNQGWWEKAEQLQMQVMEARKLKLGEDHPDTLSSMSRLALTYRKHGRWKEAEQLEVQVMKTRKTKLGEDHPSSLSIMANLASTYRNQGRWEKAEQMQAQVMQTRKTKLGPQHPSTLSSMANLASTYRNQGRLEEAEQLQIQVMEMSKSKLGVNHPSTLSSMANLASTFWKQGRLEEAEKIDVQVMEARKRKLGEDHPSSLTSMANLASTYRKQGRWEEAEMLEVQVMETRKTKLGEDHPSTLSSMANLAFTWESTGRYIDAIDMLRVCIVKQRHVIGSAHPRTVSNAKTLLEWESRVLDIDI